MKLAKYNLKNYDTFLLSGNEDLDAFLKIESAFEEST